MVTTSHARYSMSLAHVARSRMLWPRWGAALPSPDGERPDRSDRTPWPTSRTRRWLEQCDPDEFEAILHDGKETLQLRPLVVDTETIVVLPRYALRSQSARRPQTPPLSPVQAAETMGDARKQHPLAPTVRLFPPHRITFRSHGPHATLHACAGGPGQGAALPAEVAANAPAEESIACATQNGRRKVARAFAPRIHHGTPAMLHARRGLRHTYRDT